MDIWMNIILPIISGLVATIPLVIKLIDVTKKSVKEKNWAPLMQLVLKLMTEAEKNYSTGAEKKTYVIDSIAAVKDTLNYEVDMKVVEEMIDSIIEATKKINTK